MKRAPTARKNDSLSGSAPISSAAALAYSTLSIIAIILCVPLVSQAASSNATYYAIYCNKKGSNLSSLSSHHTVIGCSGSASPGIETTVQSLSSNPNGTHDVTIVEADCYPDTPSSSPSGSIVNGSISCTGGPDATLTRGQYFAASKTATASASKKKAPKSPPKKKGGSPTHISHTAISADSLPQVTADSGTLKNLLQIVFGIIGAFALLSMTLSGFKYITSGGDPGKTSEAKKGIIFALVGLMIAVMAEAIVAFVVNWAAI